MHITKLIITGANGYLSHRLVPIALARAQVIGVSRGPKPMNQHEFNTALTWHRADLSDPIQVDALFEQFQPDAVIHTAAANPGQDTVDMDRINHVGCANLARCAGERGVRLVSVSTDIVHNGSQAPYADHAPPDPINEYGKTKALGEAAIRQWCPEAAIVRTSLIYGLDQMDRGTAGFVARLNAGQSLQLFQDVIRQPVWADTLANVLCDLALEQTEESGTLNIVGDQVLSRAAFAIRMLTYWGIDVGSESNPTPSIELVSGAGIDGVPMDLRLQCDRALAAGWTLPGVDAVLSSASCQ